MFDKYSINYFLSKEVKLGEYCVDGWLLRHKIAREIEMSLKFIGNLVSYACIGTTKTMKDNILPHLLQVIQCLYEAWKACPDSAYAKHYIAGSTLALDNDLHFFNQSRKYPRFVTGEDFWGAE